MLVVDDLLASGNSLVEVGEELKRLNAGKVYFIVTYALFSEGLSAYDKAYKKGVFTKVIATNATHVPPGLMNREWFIAADVTRFIAKFIHSFNQDLSITKLLDSTEKINQLLGKKLRKKKSVTVG